MSYLHGFLHELAVVLLYVQMLADGILVLITNNHSRSLGTGTPQEHHDPRSSVWECTLKDKSYQ